MKVLILSRQAKIKEEDLGKSWSSESADFINKLLIRRPENRLGFKGVFELKEHPWFKYYPWDDLENKSLPSPFIPENKDNFDKRYCESVDRIGEDTRMRYEDILIDGEYQKVFVNFFYNKDLEREKNYDKEKGKSNNNGNSKKKNRNGNLNNINNYNMSSGKNNGIFNTINISNITNGNEYNESQMNNKKSNNNKIDSHNSNTKHKRPLSHSYSTKDVNNSKKKEYENNHNKNKNNDKNNDNGKQNQNLFNFLLQNNNNNIIFNYNPQIVNRIYSSSFLSPQQRNIKQYLNKYHTNNEILKKSERHKKNKFSRVSSASSLFNKNYQYLLNQIKSITKTNINNKGNKNSKQIYNIYSRKN